MPGSAFHGVHGLGVDKSGRLFAGSVAGAALYEVDQVSGTAKIAVPAPEGMADDIAFAPDGTMAWTGFLTGDLYSRKGDGPLKKLASDLPGINSLAYRKDGRLYATQVFLGDALYEIDTEGVKPPRKIMEKLGGLNGFEFGADDKIYGPLWFKGQVVKIDVDKPELTVVADGFKVPAAVSFDSKGSLWVVDTAARTTSAYRSEKRQEESRRAVEAFTGQSRDCQGTVHILVSNMADNGIQEVDPATGNVKQIIIGKLLCRRHCRCFGGRQGYDLCCRYVRLSRRRRRNGRGPGRRSHALPTAPCSNIRSVRRPKATMLCCRAGSPAPCN